MFGLKILKLLKISLFASTTIVGIMGMQQAVAGDVSYPQPEAPQYPAPILPPIMPPVQMQQQAQVQYQAQSQMQAQSQAEFMASIDIVATYNRYEVNNGSTTTTSSVSFVELRPFMSYNSQQDGISFGGSLFSTLIYEFGGTSAVGLGRSEVDFVVKREGDFAFGVTGGYNEANFNSQSPNPATSGSYTILDVSGFGEKRMGQFGLSLTGSYVKETYAATAQVGGGSVSEAAKDNSVYGGALRLNYHIDQSLAVFGEASLTRKKFVITPTPDLNETAYGIRVGGTYNFSAEVAVEAAVQYGYHVVDCGCTTQSYGVDAKLVASIAQNISGSISAEGEITKSTQAVLDSESVKLGAELSFQAAANVGLSTSVDYELALSGPNEGQNISANASATYGVTENIDIYAGANYGYQKGAGAGWSREVGASLGASFHF